MLVKTIDVHLWTPQQVYQWLSGLHDDCDWLDIQSLVKNNICGRRLLLLSPSDIHDMGIEKVSIVEQILEAIEKLRYNNVNLNDRTLQLLILRLACQARELQRQLASDNVNLKKQTKTNSSSSNSSRNSSLTNGVKQSTFDEAIKKQRVSLLSLSNISKIVTTVSEIAYIIDSIQLNKHSDFRSMKSLILALSIELTSTAQRDQFVENPNDILEKSSKALADYCDRIVLSSVDPSMIQSFYLERIRIKKEDTNYDLGLMIKSPPNENVHIINRILPLSPANKSNNLNEGDEIIELNGQNIVGWTANNVQKLLYRTDNLGDIILLVTKYPRD